MNISRPDCFEALEESPLVSDFLGKGYVILPTENSEGLHAIRELVADTVSETLNISPTKSPEDLLNNIHLYVGAESLNDLRLEVIQTLRSTPWVRPTYYSLVLEALHTLVGNELAMQRGLGLSVQLPNDSSSLLPIHADVWDGDSPFEVVVWVPLVDCFKTKSMYILPIGSDRSYQMVMSDHQNGSAEDLYASVSGDLEFLKIDFGSILIFTQTVMHGNRINIEDETRWSLNCRFKSALSPYADKKLGEFFEFVNLRPASRIGLDYRLPEGFSE